MPTATTPTRRRSSSCRRRAGRRRADRDRAAHASPRGGAGRRADPHDDAPRRAASTLTPGRADATAVFFGASYHADYATVLAAPADLPAVAEALVDLPRRARRAGRGTSSTCAGCAAATRPADALAAAFGAREIAEGWTLNVEREDVCPVVDLPAGATMDDYLGDARQEGAPRDPAQGPPRRGGRRGPARATRPIRSPTSRRSSTCTRSGGATAACSPTPRAARRAGSSSGACSSCTAPTARSAWRS